MRSILTRQLLWTDGKRDSEYAYFTEPLLEDGLAVREFNFTADGELMTSITLRHNDEKRVSEYGMYWGGLLAPIQSYRIVMDILYFYEKYMIDDFLEIVSESLCNESFSNDRIDYSLESQEKITSDIRKFFERIHQLK